MHIFAPVVGFEPPARPGGRSVQLRRNGCSPKTLAHRSARRQPPAACRFPNSPQTSVPPRRDNSRPLLLPDKFPACDLLKQLATFLPFQVPLPSLGSRLVPRGLLKNQLPRPPSLRPALGVQIVLPQASFRIPGTAHGVTVYFRRLQIIAAHDPQQKKPQKSP